MPMELARNTKAYLDYAFLETFEAGLVLTGAEVRSAKAGLIQLTGSYVTLRNGEAWIIGAKIAPYAKAGFSQQHYIPDHDRRLLLTKKELGSLAGSLSQKGLTIVPLSVYISKRLVKVKIALAKGKKQFDKRKAIKEKEYRRRLNSRVR